MTTRKRNKLIAGILLSLILSLLGLNTTNAFNENDNQETKNAINFITQDKDFVLAKYSKEIKIYNKDIKQYLETMKFYFNLAGRYIEKEKDLGYFDNLIVNENQVKVPFLRDLDNIELEFIKKDKCYKIEYTRTRCENKVKLQKRLELIYKERYEKPVIELNNKLNNFINNENKILRDLYNNQNINKKEKDILMKKENNKIENYIKITYPIDLYNIIDLKNGRNFTINKSFNAFFNSKGLKGTEILDINNIDKYLNIKINENKNFVELYLEMSDKYKTYLEGKDLSFLEKINPLIDKYIKYKNLNKNNNSNLYYQLIALKKIIDNIISNKYNNY